MTEQVEGPGVGESHVSIHILRRRTKHQSHQTIEKNELGVEDLTVPAGTLPLRSPSRSLAGFWCSKLAEKGQKRAISRDHVNIRSECGLTTTSRLDI